MDGSVVIKEHSLLFIFLLLQWIVALLLWKYSYVVFFFTPMDDRLVIMEGRLL